MSDKKLNIDCKRQVRYFHFNVTDFCNDFAGLVEKYMKSGTEELQNALIAEYPAEEQIIKEEIGLIQDLYQIRTREPLNKFKDAAEEIFTLPSDVSLPGFVKESAISDSDLEQLNTEVNKLEQKYIEEAYFNAELRNQAAKFEQIKSVMIMCEKALTKLQRRNIEGGKTIIQLVKSVKKCDESYLTNNTEEKVMHSNLFQRQ